ncbi:MAG: hypothetical protein B6242_14840 [Anaerolineaceae bacterium 4572_78]|nr:MAG: hypothetical protein B6242_14840 [Anaerolineaceae bacterium 4572_78]
MMLRVYLIVVMILVMTSCTNTESPSVEQEKPVIKLAQRDWLGFELDNMLAKIILEEEMGYTVEIIDIEADQQFEILVQGEAHAVLEIWPITWLNDIERYMEVEKTVEHGGNLGVLGKIGWFMPKYMVEKHPELATWEGFKDPELARLFSTPSTGDKGQFLTGSPDWLDAAGYIISNLDLPLQVEFAGSEEVLVESIITAYEKEEPILFYFWTPHYLFAKFSLTPVKLPPYSDECYAKFDTGGVDCEYPTDALLKALWPGLKDYAPDAYGFLKNFGFTNEDQISMMASVEMEGKTVEQSVRIWMEQNEVTWQAWIP